MTAADRLVATTGSLHWFNALSHEQAAARLHDCCPSDAWADRVAAARPFAGVEDLDAAAAAAVADLTDAELPAILSRYSPIAVDSGATTTAAGWSRGEEAGVHASPDAVRARLVTDSATYRERFGYTFLIAAAGLTGGQVLDELTARLRHGPDEEIGVARRHLDRICRSRVRRIVTAGTP